MCPKHCSSPSARTRRTRMGAAVGITTKHSASRPKKSSSSVTPRAPGAQSSTRLRRIELLSRTIVGAALRGRPNLSSLLRDHLRALLAAIEDVEVQLRLDPEGSLEQEIPVAFVLIHKQIQRWSDREVGPDLKTQTIFGVVAKPRVDRCVAMKFHEK